jgi:N-acetylmuramoyl-L-alanine amidase
VLKSPDVPSMLVETGHLSHPNEARELAKPVYQKRIAKAIAAGLTSYMSAHPPPGTWLASARGIPSGDPNRHVIVEGETLSGIAQRYRISTSSLRAANRLQSDTVRVGQVLVIPAS